MQLASIWNLRSGDEDYGKRLPQDFCSRGSSRAKITKGRDRTQTAKWTPRGAGRSITANVVTLVDGRQVVHVETGYFYAQYRDADGFTRTVSTRCKERANAEHFLADLERQVERVHAGVITADEVRRVEATKTVSINTHIDDYIGTLTGNTMHRANTRTYLERLRDDLTWATLADLRRDSLELWLADQTLITALCRGGSLEAAARVAGIGPSSLYRWLERGRRGDPRFAPLAAAVVQSGLVYRPIPLGDLGAGTLPIPRTSDGGPGQ